MISQIPVRAFSKAKPILWPQDQNERFESIKDEPGSLYILQHVSDVGKTSICYTVSLDARGVDTASWVAIGCEDVSLNYSKEFGLVSCITESGTEYAFDVRESVQI